MLLNKQLTSNYQLIEIQVPANSPNQKFSRPDQPLLRDKAIEKIECYNIGSLLTAPSGNSVALPNVNAYITFATDGGDEFIQNIPLMEINGILQYASLTAINGGFSLALRKIVFPKSFITYSSAAPLGTAYSFVLGIYYK
jgi:hypothetical protein